jgi:hypothetical protein
MSSKGSVTINVGAWLRDLGLGQYEAAFRDNEIDDTVLRNLTAEDLKDLDVSIVGHRRKLLDAIAGLHTNQTVTAAQSVSGPAPLSTVVATTVPAPEAAGERRHVTVMFCDLVNSTGISARCVSAAAPTPWAPFPRSHAECTGARICAFGSAARLQRQQHLLTRRPLTRKRTPQRTRFALTVIPS